MGCNQFTVQTDKGTRNVEKQFDPPTSLISGHRLQPGHGLQPPRVLLQSVRVVLVLARHLYRLIWERIFEMGIFSCLRLCC